MALAFHTSRHGFAAGSHYVLAQGVAWFSTTPDHQWLESIDANWERFMGPRDRGFPWEWWTDAYQFRLTADEVDERGVGLYIGDKDGVLVSRVPVRDYMECVAKTYAQLFGTGIVALVDALDVDHIALCGTIPEFLQNNVSFNRELEATLPKEIAGVHRGFGLEYGNMRYWGWRAQRCCLAIQATCAAASLRGSRVGD